MRSSMVGTTVAVVTRSALTSRTHSCAIEVGQVDHLAAGVQVRQRGADPGDVIRRHADQRRVGRVGRLEFDGPGDIAGQVVVRELDGLGLRRGARGEQHDRDGVRVGELGGGLGAARGRQELVGHHHPLGGVADHVPVAAVDDDQGFGQPLDQRLDAVGGQPVVDRGEGQPGARRGEDQHRQHRAAGADVGHVLGARCRDDPGAAVGEIAELLRRQPQRSLGHDGRAIGVARRSHLEKQRNAHPRSFWVPSPLQISADSVTHRLQG